MSKFPELSVPAEVSEFARAELEAFVSMNKRFNPAWTRVEELQRACRRQAPVTHSGLERSVRLLAELVD